MPYTLAQLQDLLRQAGWPDVVINTRDGLAPLIPLFASFALAESGGNPSAHNPSGEDSWGLLQVNRNAWPQYTAAQLQDPITNLRIAYQVYLAQGTRAWGVGPDWDGSYLSRGRYNDSLALYNGGSAPQWQIADDGSSIDQGNELGAPPHFVPASTAGISGVTIAILAVLGFFLAREADLI